MLRKLNPDRLMARMRGLQNTANRDVGGGFNSKYLDLFVPQIWTFGDTGGSRYNLADYNDGVILTAIGETEGHFIPINISTGELGTVYETGGLGIQNIFNDGASIYTCGQRATANAHIMKFDLDGIALANATSGIVGTTLGTFNALFSDGTNIFTAGQLDVSANEAVIVKWDTSLSFVDAHRTVATNSKIQHLTGDSTHIWGTYTITSNDNIIIQHLKSDLTLVDDRTYRIGGADVIIEEMIVDGSNLVITSRRAGELCIVGEMPKDFSGAGSAVSQATGDAITTLALCKHGTGWFVVGKTTDADNKGIILEFDSSFTLLNAKSFVGVPGHDINCRAVHSSGGDIYVGISDSQQEQPLVLKIAGGEMQSGTFTFDKSGYVFADFAATFSATTPSLVAVTTAVTTNLALTPGTGAPVIESALNAVDQTDT